MKDQANKQSTVEIFKGLLDPIDRREVIRWIIHDRNESNPLIEEVTALALQDPDWEVRFSALFCAVKFKLISLAGLIQDLEIPKSTNSGLNKEELNMLVGFRNVSLDVLSGVDIPAEPDIIESPEQKKQFLTRMVAREKIKFMHNATILYNALTFPAYPIQEFPKELPNNLVLREEKYFLDDIEMIYIPPYTAIVGSTDISYRQPKLAKIPSPTFVSKYPINYSQFILENSLKTEDKDYVRCTWDEAKLFCESLSKKHNISCHLPNMESWEIVMRGHTGRIYPWGNSFSKNMDTLGNMWGLFDYNNQEGEWTNNSIKGGRIILKGADVTMRAAEMDFRDKHETHVFRIII